MSDNLDNSEGPSKRFKGAIDDPEHFKCPICLELFKDEIYQCSNGHSICQQCFEALTKKACPNCRKLYRYGKIRNYLAENILSKMQFDCSFQAQGCREGGFSRQNLTKHEECCLFNPGPVKLCHLLFDDKCPHEVSRAFIRDSPVEIPFEFQTHMIIQHDVLIQEAAWNNKLSLTYNLAESTLDPNLNLTSFNSNILRLVDDQDSGNVLGLFIIACVKVTKTSKVSWVAVRLTDNPQAQNVRVLFSLTTCPLSESDVALGKIPPRPKLSWTGTILNIFEYRKLLNVVVGEDSGTETEMVNYMIPLSHLRKYYLNVEEKLKLEFMFTDPSNHFNKFWSPQTCQPTETSKQTQT